MKRILRLLLAGALLACAQDTLTNDSVVKMVKSGLGESLIISMVQNQPGKYTLTPDELVKLKQQGVSEKILGAMIAKSSGPAAASPNNSPNPAADSSMTTTGDPSLPPDMDVGIYYLKAGKWNEMLPEVVSWKTGGVMKSFASGGFVKGDVNGHIPGPNSQNSVASPLEVVIHPPEGTAITEYQLLRLRAHGDSREFRTMTGGVLHSSGGATRDIVPFEGKKMANRVYKVTLPNLGAGEYGFLPPGAIGSASSASIGKMYTFRVIE